MEPAVNNQLINGSASTPRDLSSTMMDNSGDVVIKHSEFLGNVYASGTGGTQSLFQNQTYSLNPGLSQTFPWLSQIANNFTLFEALGIIFEYRPTSGETGNTTNALGKVVMATNYDPDAVAFSSSVQAENYDYVSSCKPSVYMRHGIECDSNKMVMNKMMYVRSGVSAKDKVFTDIGLFQVMTEGIQLPGSGSVQTPIGELWVHYRFRFSRAQLFQTFLGGGQGMDSFIGYRLSGSTWGANTVANLPSSQYAGKYVAISGGGAFAYKTNNTIGGSVFSTGTAIQYAFPANIVQGTYLIYLWTNLSTSTNGTTLGVPTVSNGSVSYAGGTFADGTSSGTPNWEDAGSSAYSQLAFVVSVTAPGTNICTVIISWTNTTAVTNCESHLNVIELNSLVAS